MTTTVLSESLALHLHGDGDLPEQQVACIRLHASQRHWQPEEARLVVGARHGGNCCGAGATGGSTQEPLTTAGEDEARY